MHRSSCRRRSPRTCRRGYRSSARRGARPRGPAARDRRRRPSTCRAPRMRSRTPAARCCRRAAHRRDVRAAVAVPVPAAPHGRARTVARRRAVDTEAARAESGQIDRAARGPAEQHVRRAGVVPAVVVGLRRADRDVGPPVAVHVTHPGDRRSGKVEGGGTANLVAAGAERVQPDRVVEAFPKTTYAAPACCLPGTSVWGAPTTRSGRASPLTSPRPATDQPASAPALGPWIS